jgi:small GTP-binding protein
MFNLPNGHNLSHYKNFNKNLRNQAVSTNLDYIDDTIPLAEPYDPILPKQNNDESYINATYTIKVIFLGDTNTGKTCAMYSLQNNVHMDTPASTIGVEFASIKRQINNICFKYNIWDTAGQEKYRSITHSFFKNSGIAVLFFDLTNYNSFQSLSQWLYDIHNNCPEDVIILLVGNKVDIAKRQVEQCDIKRFMYNNNLTYYTEVSAKTGESIETILFTPAQILIDKIINKKMPVSDIPGIRTDQYVEVKTGKKSPLCSNCSIV